MTRLMRTSEIAKLPVVTLAGEDVAQIKDIVYSPDGGAVVGFTLAGRGLLAGPLKEGLSWTAVTGLGPDAVMIADQSVLAPVEEVVAAATAEATASRKGGNVLGDQVLTDSGRDLGTVVDAVISFDNATGGQCDVVGYEITASEALSASTSSKGAKGTRLLVPLPDTLAVSGQHLMVPASAEGFVTDDLAGFGAAVEAFRAQLGATPGPGTDDPGTVEPSTHEPSTLEPSTPEPGTVEPSAAGVGSEDPGAPDLDTGYLGTQEGNL